MLSRRYSTRFFLPMVVSSNERDLPVPETSKSAPGLVLRLSSTTFGQILIMPKRQGKSMLTRQPHTNFLRGPLWSFRAQSRFHSLGRPASAEPNTANNDASHE